MIGPKTTRGTEHTEHRLWSQTSQDEMPAAPLPGCMILSRFPHFSVLWFLEFKSVSVVMVNV